MTPTSSSSSNECSQRRKKLADFITDKEKSVLECRGILPTPKKNFDNYNKDSMRYMLSKKSIEPFGLRHTDSWESILSEKDETIESKLALSNASSKLSYYQKFKRQSSLSPNVPSPPVTRRSLSRSPNVRASSKLLTPTRKAHNRLVPPTNFKKQGSIACITPQKPPRPSLASKGLNAVA